MLANLVLPGVALVRANGWRTSALIRLDLPTFDRPTKATSGDRSRGKSAAPAALVTNSATICTSRWLFASLLALGSGFTHASTRPQGLEPVSRKPWSVWTRVSCGFCNIGDDGSGGNARRQRLGQRNLQHLVHRRHHVHVERVHDVLGNVGQILLVVTWQDDIRHPGAMSGEYLFLDAANG